MSQDLPGSPAGPAAESKNEELAVPEKYLERCRKINKFPVEDFAKVEHRAMKVVCCGPTKAGKSTLLTRLLMAADGKPLSLFPVNYDSETELLWELKRNPLVEGNNFWLTPMRKDLIVEGKIVCQGLDNLRKATEGFTRKEIVKKYGEGKNPFSQLSIEYGQKNTCIPTEFRDIILIDTQGTGEQAAMDRLEEDLELYPTSLVLSCFQADTSPFDLGSFIQLKDMLLEKPLIGRLFIVTKVRTLLESMLEVSPEEGSKVEQYSKVFEKYKTNVMEKLAKAKVKDPQVFFFDYKIEELGEIRDGHKAIRSEIMRHRGSINLLRYNVRLHSESIAKHLEKKLFLILLIANDKTAFGEHLMKCKEKFEENSRMIESNAEIEIKHYINDRKYMEDFKKYYQKKEKMLMEGRPNIKTLLNRLINHMSEIGYRKILAECRIGQSLYIY